MNYLLLIAAAAVIAVIFVMTKKRITTGSSCCGEHEAPVEHVKAADTDPSHYPHCYLLKVEGMVCANCARRVENAFNGTGEMLAVVNLGKKEVRLFLFTAAKFEVFLRVFQRKNPSLKAKIARVSALECDFRKLLSQFRRDCE